MNLCLSSPILENKFCGRKNIESKQMRFVFGTLKYNFIDTVNTIKRSFYWILEFFPKIKQKHSITKNILIWENCIDFKHFSQNILFIFFLQQKPTFFYLHFYLPYLIFSHENFKLKWVGLLYS